MSDTRITRRTVGLDQPFYDGVEPPWELDGESIDMPPQSAPVVAAKTPQGRSEAVEFVTVFCDASFCPNTRAYGWACWAKYGQPSETVRLSGGGVHPEVLNSTDAEFMALIEGISGLIQRNVEFSGRIVVIQSDSLGALERFERNGQPRNQLLRRAVRHIKLKHVKGHRGHADRRASVNTWCDKVAKHEMRRVRDTLSATSPHFA